MSYYGVNAHHKNGMTDRASRIVSECSRAQLLHAAMYWKDGVSNELWYMVVDYTVYLYNHLPNENDFAPADLFTGVISPRHKLKDCHI